MNAIPAVDKMSHMSQVLYHTPLRGAPEDARLQRAPRRAKSDLKMAAMLPGFSLKAKRNQWERAAVIDSG